MTESF